MYNTLLQVVLCVFFSPLDCILFEGKVIHCCVSLNPRIVSSTGKLFNIWFEIKNVLGSLGRRVRWEERVIEA